MNRDFNIKVKNSFKMDNIITSKNKLEETILKSKDEYLKAKSRKRIEFKEFLKMQIKFLGKEIWLIQGVFMIIIFLSLKSIFKELLYTANYGEGVIYLIFNISLLTGLSNIFFLIKSYKANMYELENSTYMSMSKILFSRFLIIGIGNIVTFIGIFYEIVINGGMTFYIALSLLIFPYLLISCGNNYLIKKLYKGENINLLIAFTIFVFFTINLILISLSIVKLDIFIKILMPISILLIGVLIIQFRKMYYSIFDMEV